MFSIRFGSIISCFLFDGWLNVMALLAGRFVALNWAGHGEKIPPSFKSQNQGRRYKSSLRICFSAYACFTCPLILLFFCLCMLTSISFFSFPLLQILLQTSGSKRRGKTSFVEHRTFLHIYHSFHRLWIFLVMMFQVCKSLIWITPFFLVYLMCSLKSLSFYV